MSNTITQYNSIIAICREIFIKKAKDYGTSWRIMRMSSITDQIFIKAQRIRTIQEVGNQQVDEDIHSEFIAIVNYSIIGLIQLQLMAEKNVDLELTRLAELYDWHVDFARELMNRKNHDYGEAWRLMRISSLVDLLLMKVMRVKQIEDNKNLTIASEGVDANYYDMLNYAIFALIRLKDVN